MTSTDVVVPNVDYFVSGWFRKEWMGRMGSFEMAPTIFVLDLNLMSISG